MGRLFQCQVCHLGFRDPALDINQLQEIYRDLPAQHWSYDPARMGSWRTALAFLRKRAGASPLEVLDVGAFDGGFLSQLPALWTKAAIEPCAAGRDQLLGEGVEIVGEWLEERGNKHLGGFDAVSLFDVFEHLSDPAAGLRSALGYLRPGGVLLVSTGNLDHWSFRLLRGDHWYFEPPQHIRFGSERYFREFCRREGCWLVSMQRISHQRGTWLEKFREALLVLHFGWRRCGGLLRLMARLIGRIPHVRAVRHKAAPPYTQHLSDHVFVVIEKP